MRNRSKVYIMTNKAMPGLVKIGWTGKDDVEQRRKELSNTSVPYPFVVEAEYDVYMKNADKIVHEWFPKELRVNDNREFFNVTVPFAKKIIEDAQQKARIFCVVDEEDDETNDGVPMKATVLVQVQPTKGNPSIVKVCPSGSPQKPAIDLLLMPETKIGTRLYADVNNKKFYCTVIDHRTVDILGEEYPLGEAFRLLMVCVTDGLSSCDWVNLCIDDGRTLGELWNNYISSNSNIVVKTSTANNEELHRICHYTNVISNGDAVKDAVTGEIGKWVDVDKAIVKFNGHPEMSARAWVKKNYAAKKTKFYKHFIDMRSGKLLSDLKREGILDLGRKLKQGFN